MSRYLLVIVSVSALLVSLLAVPLAAAASVDTVLQAENVALSADRWAFFFSDLSATCQSRCGAHRAMERTGGCDVP